MIRQTISRWLSKAPSDRSVANVPPGVPTFSLTTDAGGRRPENQDRLVAFRVSRTGISSRGFTCAVLADGMGGLPNGSASAANAIAAFAEVMIQDRNLSPIDRIKKAILDANTHVSMENAGGGTTISIVLFEHGNAIIANVGDSRIYAIDSLGDSKKLRKLTTDDTMRDAFGGEGEGLLQFVGMGKGISPHIKNIDVRDKRLLLTSDGTHRMGDELMSQLLTYADAPSIGCRRLVDVARWMGGWDNASAIIVDLDYEAEERADENSSITFWTTDSELHLVWYSQAHNARLVEPKDKLGEPEKLPKPRAKRGRNKKIDQSDDNVGADEQIEIGFSDDGDGDKQ